MRQYTRRHKFTEIMRHSFAPFKLKDCVCCLYTLTITDTKHNVWGPSAFNVRCGFVNKVTLARAICLYFPQKYWLSDISLFCFIYLSTSNSTNNGGHLHAFCIIYTHSEIWSLTVYGTGLTRRCCPKVSRRSVLKWFLCALNYRRIGSEDLKM